MSDKITLTPIQSDLVDVAIGLLKEELGVKVTRGQCMGILAKRYIDAKSWEVPRNATAVVSK